MEDLSHAWLAGDTSAPAQGQTLPLVDKPEAYTWCKAPRYNGGVAETGVITSYSIHYTKLYERLLAPCF